MRCRKRLFGIVASALLLSVSLTCLSGCGGSKEEEKPAGYYDGQMKPKGTAKGAEADKKDGNP